METILITALLLLALVLWIWAVIDILRSDFKDIVQKIIWLLVVIFFPILGSIVYFQLGRKYTSRPSIRFAPKFGETQA